MRMLPSIKFSVIVFGLVYLTAMTVIFAFFNSKCRFDAENYKLPINKTDKKRQHSSTFGDALEHFPWDEYKDSMYHMNLTATQLYTQKLFLLSLEHLQKAPKSSASSSCRPPPPFLLKTLTCNKLPKSRKVGMLLQFDYNVDALEVHLHELHDVVDKFFIIESSRQINTYLETKPLLWDRLKNDERFSKFLSKIVYFTVDDSAFVVMGGLKSKRRIIYSNELLLERSMWVKFLQWNTATNFFGADDLIGFGEASEIPYRNNIFTLKTCQFYSYAVDIGIWSPIRGLEGISQTNFPVKSNPYTLASSTFWTVQSAIRSFNTTGNVPTRLRGKGPAFLLGGMYMSNMDYLPYLIVKLLGNSNLKETVLRRVAEMGRLYKTGIILETSEFVERMRKEFSLVDRQKALNITVFRSSFPEESSQIIKIPWFIDCNPNRYEYLFKENSALELTNTAF